jgi:hypothetical protein
MQDYGMGNFIASVLYFVWAVCVVVFFLKVLSAMNSIRAQSVDINKRLRTLNMILREVHGDMLKPGACPNCHTSAPFGQNNCAKCGKALEW